MFIAIDIHYRDGYVRHFQIFVQFSDKSVLFNHFVRNFWNSSSLKVTGTVYPNYKEVEQSLPVKGEN